MHTLHELEKQQVGLRLNTYLVNELDDMTKAFSVNRSDIIVEAIKAYISEHKALMLYQGFEVACSELQQEINQKQTSLPTLTDLIDELDE